MKLLTEQVLTIQYSIAYGISRYHAKIVKIVIRPVHSISN